MVGPGTRLDERQGLPFLKAAKLIAVCRRVGEMSSRSGSVTDAARGFAARMCEAWMAKERFVGDNMRPLHLDDAISREDRELAGKDVEQDERERHEEHDGRESHEQIRDHQPVADLPEDMAHHPSPEEQGCRSR